MNLKVIESNKEGFKGVWEEGLRKGTLGTQYTNFIAPALIYQNLTSKQFGRTLTVVYATPISKGKCRLFARFPFKFASKIPAFLIKLTPTWYSHLGNNKVLEDDQIFLHYQERYLAAKGGFENFSKAFYLPTKADAYIFELRNWFNNYQADPFPGESLPPLLTKEQLLERYHSHTKKCSSCRKALANIQNLRTFCGIIAAFAWIVAPFIWFEFGASFGLALSSTIVTLILAIARFGLGKFEERFYLGTEIPPRNLPDRK